MEILGTPCSARQSRYRSINSPSQRRQTSGDRSSSRPEDLTTTQSELLDLSRKWEDLYNSDAVKMALECSEDCVVRPTGGGAIRGVTAKARSLPEFALRPPGLCDSHRERRGADTSRLRWSRPLCAGADTFSVRALSSPSLSKSRVRHSFSREFSTASEWALERDVTAPFGDPPNRVRIAAGQMRPIRWSGPRLR